MLEQIANHLRGYLKIRITGYSPERFLNLCKNKNIVIWDLEAKSNSYEMYVTVDGFKKLKPLLKKTRTKIEIIEKHGTPFFFHKYRKRKLFFAGIFLGMCLIYGLSLFIWNIEIQGNFTITDEVLIEFLESQYVYHGMRRSKVECESIGTQIRKQFDDIIWVSVSLEGSNLIIHVKENTDTFQVSQTEETPSDIISTADGTILEIITRSGVPSVNVGDVVKKGDLLVTGKLEVKNDAGEVIREDYKCAEADIYAEVMIPYEDFCNTKHELKVYNDKSQKRVYLRVFGYEAVFGVIKGKEENYEISSSYTQLKLNSNFEIPVFLGKLVGKEYETTEVDRTKEEKLQILNENLELFLEKLEEENCEILEKQVQAKEEADGIRASGYVRVKQSIGTVRKSIDF